LKRSKHQIRYPLKKEIFMENENILLISYEILYIIKEEISQL